MGSTVFPAASAGKTMFRTTLTSGTSYTVPAGVTYLNVTLIGAGGGGGGGYDSGERLSGMPGNGGSIISSTLTATAGNSIAYAIGAGGTGGAGSSGGTNNGTSGGNTTFTGATTASGGTGGNGASNSGLTGTAAQSAENGGCPGGFSTGANGATGGAGAIYVEYWV